MSNSNVCSKRLYDKRRSQKSCVTCGCQDERTLAGKCRCAFCTKKAAVYMRDYTKKHQREKSDKYHEKVSNRICVKCGKPNPTNWVHCAECHANVVEKEREYTKRVRVQGGVR